MSRCLSGFLKFASLISPVLRLGVIPSRYVTNRLNNVPMNNQMRSIKYEIASRQETIIRIPSLFRLWCLSILTWLGFSAEDEEKESELVMILKRAILCTKREQFNKAEQLLHIGLKLAQEQQNEQGVVYCYDLMANLAFEQGELRKAEKLFVALLQMILSKGVKQDDLKVIHISLKLARICQLMTEMEKAQLGYQWCLLKISEYDEGNLDSQILHGVIHDWYAQYLLDKGDVPRAIDHLKEAHRICEKTMGVYNEKSMLLLNDLGITSFRAGDVKNAELYLNKGIKIGNNINNSTQIGVLYANLGLVLLDQGLVKEAEKSCKQALNIGRRSQDNESIEQANYCFDQIKINWTK